MLANHSAGVLHCGMGSQHNMHVEEIVPFDRRQPRSLKCVSAILDRKQIYNWPTLLSITLYVYLDQRPISLHANQTHTLSLYIIFSRSRGACDRSSARAIRDPFNQVAERYKFISWEVERELTTSCRECGPVLSRPRTAFYCAQAVDGGSGEAKPNHKDDDDAVRAATARLIILVSASVVVQFLFYRTSARSLFFVPPPSSSVPSLHQPLQSLRILPPHSASIFINKLTPNLVHFIYLYL